MKFDHFQQLMAQIWSLDDTGAPKERFEQVEAEKLPPLVLAYVGDAFFSLYLRCRLLKFEQNQVRVLHTLDSRMVSAVMQARAYYQLEELLTNEEKTVVRRARNAKSSVPKSASVAEYRASTGFEALLGYLYIKGNHSRLDQLVDQAFVVIAKEMAENRSTKKKDDQ